MEYLYGVLEDAQDSIKFIENEYRNYCVFVSLPPFYQYLACLGQSLPVVFSLFPKLCLLFRSHRVIGPRFIFRLGIMINMVISAWHVGIFLSPTKELITIMITYL